MRLNSRRTRGCATSQTTLFAVALLTLLGAGALWSVTGGVSEKASKSTAPELSAQARSETVSPARLQARSLVARAQLPLAFEPNQGQTDARAAYVAHGSGYGVFLTSNEAIVALDAGSKNGSPAAVHMQLEGAAASPKIVASGPLPGKTHYFRGKDSRRWIRNVPTFARVEYSAVYPGIDLVYYGQQGQIEYDFAVHAGADPNQIHLKLAGVEKVSLGTDGSLRLKTPVREVRWNKPSVYQKVNGKRHPVAGRFQLLANNRVAFALGRYDRSRELIIDPVLAYATYFGGSGNEVNPQVAVDLNSNIYLAGTTSSPAVPGPACGGTGEPVCPVLSGASDVFISKLDPVGSFVVYTTYLNASDLTSLDTAVSSGAATLADSSAGLAVDNQGNAYITGTTTSADFPVTTGAFQSAPKAAGAHVFLTKLDSTGANLLYSSYLSGSNTDNALALAADNLGRAYILGSTLSVASGDFPTGTSFQQSANGATHLYFVAKFDTALSGAGSLKFFSYLGGGDPSNAATPADGVVCAQLPCGGIALDSTGNAFIAVGTSFTNMPAINAYQSAIHGASDAFITKISADGSGLLYATYLGGGLTDGANAIALDSSGNAYVTGFTTSTDFPVGSVKGITPYAGSTDAFVAKVSNPTTGAVTLTFSSYLGGSGTDIGFGIAADTTQNAYVAGSTNSANFPVQVGGTVVPASGTDAFFVKMNTSVGYDPALTPPVSPISASSLVGGSGTDRATSVAQNVNGGALVSGETNSANFPVQSKVPGVPTPLQSALGGASDAFLANFGPNTDLSLTIAAAPNPVAAGNNATFTYSVKNNGPDSSTGAVVTIPVPSGAVAGVTVGAFATTSGSCAATGTTGNQVETCTLGTIAANSSATITVPLTPTVIAPPNGTNNVPGSIQMDGHVSAGNSAVDLAPGNNIAATAKAGVEFFTTAVTPPSVSIPAGQTATYNISIMPHAPAGVTSVGFPGSITLKCTPQTTPITLAGTTCTFTPATFTNIPVGTGSTTSVLKVTTTRPTQTASVHAVPTFWYAMWLPLCGVAFLGAGSTRRRRWMSGAALVVLLGTVVFLPACGSKSSATATTGTQPGTYSIAISASSGSYTYPPATSPLNVSLTVTAP